MDHDERFLARALELALKGSELNEGGPFGAVLVHAGKIIGEGWNRVVASSDPTAHAEIGAIRMACAAVDSFHLPESTLYASSEPCPMCLSAIYWARLDALYYAASRHDASRAGCDDGFLYEQVALPPEQRTLTSQHLPGEDFDKPFALWAANARKIPY